MRLRGVGVDVVDLNRIKRMLKGTGSRPVDRLLSQAEIRRLRGRKITPVGFAKLFAAKEAFFKCLDRSWLGVDGFRDLEIKASSPGRFTAETKSGKGKIRAQGHYFRKDRWVGAQVILWEK